MDLKSYLFIVVCALFVFLEVKAEEKKLQIGVKKRIPENECDRKSKNGDTLHMHYKVRTSILIESVRVYIM